MAWGTSVVAVAEGAEVGHQGYSPHRTPLGSGGTLEGTMIPEAANGAEA